MILLSTLFISLMSYAKETNKTALKPNAELIGSWQYVTTYYTGDRTCYTETENFLFYSDKSCVKRKIVTSCDNQVISETASTQQWMTISNNIVLLDASGRQQAAYTTKHAVADLLKGEKIISQRKDVSTSPALLKENVAIAFNQ